MRFRALTAGLLAFVLAALPAAAQVVEFGADAVAPVGRLAPPPAALGGTIVAPVGGLAPLGLGGELAAHADRLAPVLALPAATARDVALIVAAHAVTPAQKAAGLQLLDALAGPSARLGEVRALIAASPAGADPEKRRTLASALKRLSSNPDFRRDLARETSSLRALFDGAGGETTAADARVLKKIDDLDAAGAPVNVRSMRVVRSSPGAAAESGSMMSLHPDGTLVVDARRLDRAEAKLSPAAFQIRLESQLLAEQLKAGLPPPLRGSAEEVESVRRGSSLSPVRDYQDKWLSKLEAPAPGDFPPLPPFQSRRPKERQIFRDGGVWLAIDGNRIRSFDASGRTRAERRVPEAWLAAYDADSRTLFLPDGPRKRGRTTDASFFYFMDGFGIQAVDVSSGKSRTFKLPGNFWIENRLQWDPVSRRLIGLIWEGKEWSLAQWPRTAKGFGPPVLIPLGKDRLSVAFDFARRRVFLAAKWGDGAESRALNPDGTLGKPVPFLTGESVSDLLVSGKQGVVAASVAQGQAFFQLGRNGEVLSRSAEIPLAAGSLTAAGDEGWLYFKSGEKRARLLRPDFAEASSPIVGLADRTGAADALAAALTHRPDWAQEIARSVRGDDALVAAIWGSWARRWRGGRLSGQDLRNAPGSTRWLPGAESELKETMPTLRRMLGRPRQLGAFLAMLSFLRLVYPYTGSSRSPRTPLSFALESGRVFRLNELMIMPDTESFRRHMIAAAVRGGLKILELKIPGAVDGRTFLGRATFEAARDLWTRFPGDPRTARVPYFGWFKGKATLYGKPMSFDQEEAGLALADYSDGKRLSNRLLDPKNAAGDAYLQVLADAAVTSIRLHELGWSGVDPDSNGTEMHRENVRWLENGRGELVSDFNAMNRRRLPTAERRAETLSLIGRGSRLGALQMEDDEERARLEIGLLLPRLYPLVLDGVAAGAARSERARLARVVQEELDYRPPPTPRG